MKRKPQGLEYRSLYTVCGVTYIEESDWCEIPKDVIAIANSGGRVDAVVTEAHHKWCRTPLEVLRCR